MCGPPASAPALSASGGDLHPELLPSVGVTRPDRLGGPVQWTRFETRSSGNFNHHRDPSACHLCQTKGGLGDTTKQRIYKVCIFETSVQHDAQIKCNSYVSNYFKVWSYLTLDTSLVPKPFEGGNLIEGLMGRRFELAQFLSSHHRN